MRHFYHILFWLLFLGSCGDSDPDPHTDTAIDPDSNDTGCPCRITKKSVFDANFNFKYAYNYTYGNNRRLTREEFFEGSANNLATFVRYEGSTISVPGGQHNVSTNNGLISSLSMSTLISVRGQPVEFYIVNWSFEYSGTDLVRLVFRKSTPTLGSYDTLEVKTYSGYHNGRPDKISSRNAQDFGYDAIRTYDTNNNLIREDNYELPYDPGSSPDESTTYTYDTSLKAAPNGFFFDLSRNPNQDSRDVNQNFFLLAESTYPCIEYRTHTKKAAYEVKKSNAGGYPLVVMVTVDVLDCPGNKILQTATTHETYEWNCACP